MFLWIIWYYLKYSKQIHHIRFPIKINIKLILILFNKKSEKSIILLIFNILIIHHPRLNLKLIFGPIFPRRFIPNLLIFLNSFQWIPLKNSFPHPFQQSLRFITCINKLFMIHSYSLSQLLILINCKYLTTFPFLHQISLWYI